LEICCYFSFSLLQAAVWRLNPLNDDIELFTGELLNITEGIIYRNLSKGLILKYLQDDF